MHHPFNSVRSDVQHCDTGFLKEVFAFVGLEQLSVLRWQSFGSQVLLVAMYKKVSE